LAVVRIAGHDHYLGKYGNPESYDRLVAEWLAMRHNGCSVDRVETKLVRPAVAVRRFRES
jgi:hypothetical protein